MPLKKTPDVVCPHLVNSPPRITDVQAKILWWLREHPEAKLSESHRSGLSWNGWSHESHSPWGRVPNHVAEGTARALLRRHLLRPVIGAKPVVIADQPVRSNVVAVDFHGRDTKPAAELARTLIDLSQRISGGRLANPAHAMVIVLTGPNGHELLHVGHRNGRELREACATAGSYYYAAETGPAFYGTGAPYLTISLEGRAALLHKQKWDAIKLARELPDQWQACREVDRIIDRFSPLEIELHNEVKRLTAGKDAP